MGFFFLQECDYLSLFPRKNGIFLPQEYNCFPGRKGDFFPLRNVIITQGKLGLFSLWLVIICHFFQGKMGFFPLRNVIFVIFPGGFSKDKVQLIQPSPSLPAPFSDLPIFPSTHRDLFVQSFIPKPPLYTIQTFLYMV